MYPDRWAAVTSSGNDVFLRNPFNVDQNLFVDISSPSSSRCEQQLVLHTWIGCICVCVYVCGCVV